MNDDYVPAVRLKDLQSAPSLRAAKSLADVLSVPLDSLFASRTITTTREEDSLQTALTALIDGRILSLPVYSKSKRRFVGLIGSWRRWWWRCSAGGRF